MASDIFGRRESTFCSAEVQLNRIVLITPARNEEKYIRTTIECMLAQTIKPVKWIIVNDGSNDDTEKIIKEYLSKSSFIQYVKVPDRGYRKPGQGVVETFYEGLKLIKEDNYDIISKFDADLAFPPKTLESIIDVFDRNHKLGITGGTRYDRVSENGEYREVLVPKGFVGGPFKFYRKKCFDDIGGLIKRAGWDGVDTIKANMKGWETEEITTLKILHLRPTGTANGEGLKNACKKYGDVSYYMGGYIWYFVLRIIARSAVCRNPMVGFYMVIGYLKSLCNNEVRECEEFRSFLKKTQIKNVNYWFKKAFKFLSIKIIIVGR